MQYDHPEFLVTRVSHLKHDIAANAISCPSLTTSYIGSTLNVFQKCLVLGATIRVNSGGSASGTNSLSITRVNAGGTVSDMETFAITAKTAGDTFDVSLATGVTLASLTEGVCLNVNAASLDKVFVVADIWWRYRMLPRELEKNLKS